MSKIVLEKTSTIICLFTLFFNHNVHAAGGAVRGPIDASENKEVASVDFGVIDLNPNKNIVSTNAGYDSITSIKVDTTKGSIHGYTSYSLNTDTTYTNISEAGSSTMLGTVSLQSYLVAPNPNVANTVDVTVEMELDGSFIINNGSPTLLLGADIAATTASSLLPINGTIYQSDLIFLSSIDNPINTPIKSSFMSSETSLITGNSSSYNGGSFSIQSETLANIDAILRLTFPLSIGDSLSLNGLITASAAPSPDPSNTNPLGPIDILASDGAVDFSNTAKMFIYLPEGYSLGGNDPLLDNIVRTTVVPIAPSIWFLASAFLALFGFRFRQAE